MIMLGINDGSRLMAIAFIKRCQICIQFSHRCIKYQHLEIQAHLNLPSTNTPNMGTGTHEHVHKCRLAHAKSNLRVLGEFFSPHNPNP